MGSVIIVDTAWNEGYSVVIPIPVTEDFNGWHGTITFSHPVLSVTVSRALINHSHRFWGFQSNYVANSFCMVVLKGY